MRGITILTRSALMGLVLMAFGQVSASAQSSPKPLDDDRTHMGVATCGGTTCHSRQAPTGATVRQNEVVTWQDSLSVTGAHSRAYAVLLTNQSRRIANNLGLGAPEQSAVCLNCHTHNVAADQRGELFDIREGVTCEACHGGSGDWLTTHYATDSSHQTNIANGLYPTENVAARASLCLDCHFGSDRGDQFVTHRIMGAGHPRISFELDLFTALQRHHDEDMDYRDRKDAAGGVKTWAVGQAMAMARSATLFADDQIGTDGLFPEFYFFDCHACHQTISNDPKAIAGWRPNPGRPLGPGVPVYNDANLIMLKALVAEVAPEEAETLRRLTTRIHAATASGRQAVKRASEELASFGDRLSTTMQSRTISGSQSVGVINRILDGAITAEYTNYAAGEQAVIAVDTFLNAMLADETMTRDMYDALQPVLDEAYNAVESPNLYNPAALRTALSNIASQTRGM